MTMTGKQVADIRFALGRALGRDRLTKLELGFMLGLSDRNAKITIQRWESDRKEVSGPAVVALRLLGYAAGIGELPEEIGNMSINFRAVMLALAHSLLSHADERIAVMAANSTPKE